MNRLAPLLCTEDTPARAGAAEGPSRCCGVAAPESRLPTRLTPTPRRVPYGSEVVQLSARHHFYSHNQLVNHSEGWGVLCSQFSNVFQKEAEQFLGDTEGSRSVLPPLAHWGGLSTAAGTPRPVPRGRGWPGCSMATGGQHSGDMRAPAGTSSIPAEGSSPGPHPAAATGPGALGDRQPQCPDPCSSGMARRSQR